MDQSSPYEDAPAHAQQNLSISAHDGMTEKYVEEKMTMEKKLKQWKQSKRNASVSRITSLRQCGQNVVPVQDNSRFRGTKRNAVEHSSLLKIKTSTCQSKNLLSRKNSRVANHVKSSSYKSSTQLETNVRPQRLLKSVSCYKTHTPVISRTKWNLAGSAPHQINIFSTSMDQTLFNLSATVKRKIDTASTKHPKKPNIILEQHSILSSEKNDKDTFIKLKQDTQVDLHLGSVKADVNNNNTSLDQNLTKLKNSRENNPALDNKIETERGDWRNYNPPEPEIAGEEPEQIAKALIKVAIDFEKKQRMKTAFHIFSRAYHILPTKSVKLAERLERLADACPAATIEIPSQEMSTATYMKKVLERDLMDVLNHGTAKELIELFAIGHKRAMMVIDKRPFDQVWCIYFSLSSTFADQNTNQSTSSLTLKEC